MGKGPLIVRLGLLCSGFCASVYYTWRIHVESEKTGEFPHRVDSMQREVIEADCDCIRNLYAECVKEKRYCFPFEYLVRDRCTRAKSGDN